MSYDGPDRRAGRCDLHERNTDAIERLTIEQSSSAAAARTWRLVGGLAGTFAIILASSIGWVITDTLKILRDDIKEIKVELKEGNKTAAQYMVQVEQLSERVSTLEEVIFRSK